MKPVGIPETPNASALKYKVPGVYVEEVGTPATTIVSVDPSIAAFVGSSLKGPVDAVSELLTSYADFVAVYGDVSDITFCGPTAQMAINYLALAARAFFDNGGRSLYISRVSAPDGTNSAPPTGDDYVRALQKLEEVSRVAVVAAPGGAIGGVCNVDSVAPIHAALIAHVSQAKAYRFAVLDPPPGCSISDIQAVRATVDSANAALYFPWVTIADPRENAAEKSTLNVPPSGFICGIYSRVDHDEGVFKSIGSQQVIDALGFEHVVTLPENDLLNAQGINCLRTFTGRGNLVWGARTVSSDPEWKYVNVRRYLLYLEHSVDQGMQWVVFEPNNERTWASVLAAVSAFLYAQWRSGALMGVKAEEAFFVRCDRTTMSQSDIDKGQLVCLIGFAPLKAAEFVVIQISQLTADAGTTPQNPTH
ncbi:MAG: phage tail sheath C-terminal domain-containing protein [Granulicella sp.]